MKVRIYKASDGKGKLVKAKDGMAVNTDKEIKRKIAEGKDPEIIIYEMAEFGLSRDQARDKVYKLYDLLGDDEYDEDEPAAPYDEPVEDEVAEAAVEEEEEPDNAAIYDYYGGDNQGLAVVNDGADDEDEEDDMARYGGQYAEGGQFAPGSIIPKPKKPYYIGMDAEPYDNAYKFGGLTKGAYVKKRIKELRKAAQGDEVQNNETNISPRGTIDSPSGFTSPEKNLASVIKQNANEAVLKQQAENEYQQYQNSTMGQDFNGKFLFGGRNRKIRRANRAMFGTPTAIPGVDVSYEFGPLGGLRKAEANWDLDAIGDLAKLLPGAMNMMPGMFPGMMSYKKVSYPAQVRKKTINTINNVALDEVAKQNPNSTAAQNNKSSKKNEISCPPGSVYDPSLGHCVDQEGNRVRSIIDLPDPEELLGNPFENPNARMLNGKKTMKATGPSASASSTAASQSTQTPSAGGAPLQNQQNVMYSPMSPVLNAQGQQLTSDASNMMYGQQGLPPVLPSAPVASEWKGVYDPATDSYIDDSSMLYEFMTNNPDLLNDPESEKTYNQMGYSSEDFNKAKARYLSEHPAGSTTPSSSVSSSTTPTLEEAVQWKGVYNPETNSYIDDSNMLYEFMTNNPDIVNDPTMEKTYNEMGYSSEDWNKAKSRFLSERKQVGGFVDAANMDPNTLAKFIYGGDEYAYGGDVLHKAYDGYITNFQKQMNATKSRIDQMGNKKPEELLGNPFRGNAFGNATTGIQPSGTVGNRFQSSGQPNTGTTTQGGTGTTTNTNQTKTTTTTNQGQPQFDANTMAQFQQYMQMMQGQPGMGQFSVGRPQRLGFGLTRDFNYTSGFSPVNWQVPEGTKGVKQTSYKDRGKWYNPFDTKRITEWRIDNGEIVDSDKSKSEMQDKAGTATDTKTGTNTTTTETQGPENMPGYEPGAAGPGLSGFNADSNGNQIPDYLEAENPQDGTTAGVNSTITTNDQSNVNSTGSSQPRVPVNEQMGVDKESWDSMSWQDQTDMMNAVGDQSKAPTRPITVGAGNTNAGTNTAAAGSANPFSGNAFGTAGTGVTGQKPNIAFPQNQPGGPLNEQGIIRREYGGYVPEYMAYGGYIPMAKSGITAGKPEFEDPNLIGRTVEQSAYTFKPGQLATDLFSGPTSLTGLTTNILNARDESKKMNQAAQRSRTSDAATANTGQSGFGSAERKGSDLMASGNETQYGSTPGKQGYEGGLYGKKGGSMNTQYAKGKVYSLTMDQIKAIEAAGGKVEYIK